MSGKVLVYSRFPKAMMVPIGERYDLLDSKGRALEEAFSPAQLSDVRVLISAGATRLPAQVMDLLPSLKAPTVSQLFGEGGFAVEAVVPKVQMNTLIPALSDAGASGIIELPIAKIVP